MDQAKQLTGLSREEILGLEGIHSAAWGTVFLSGSLVEGFGNNSSDVDIFVIGSRTPSGPLVSKLPGRTISNHYYGNRRVDFEFWTPEALDELALRLKQIDGERGRLDLALSSDETALLHRIKIGVSLLDPEGLAALRARLDFDRLRSYLVNLTLRRIDDALEDVIGMLERDDFDVALHRARMLLDFAVDALGYHLGNTNDRTKWRPKIMRSLAHDGRMAEAESAYWALQYPDVQHLRRDADACRQHLQTCIRFTNRITDWIVE